MAITLTARGTINSAADLTSYASGSFTPSANVLLIAVYNVTQTSADPTTPTVSGHGTWTNVHELQWNNLTDRGKLFLFALNTGGSPGASTVTFSHGATTHAGAEASIFELGGTDVATGVSQCFVQFVDSSVNTTGGASELSLTLAAAGNSGNRPFMVTSRNENSVATPKVNWTEIHDLVHTTPNMSTETQWREDAFETGTFCDYVNLVRRGGFAWEVKIAGAGGGSTVIDPFGMSGFFGA